MLPALWAADFFPYVSDPVAEGSVAEGAWAPDAPHLPVQSELDDHRPHALEAVHALSVTHVVELNDMSGYVSGILVANESVEGPDLIVREPVIRLHPIGPPRKLHQVVPHPRHAVGRADARLEKTIQEHEATHKKAVAELQGRYTT